MFAAMSNLADYLQENGITQAQFATRVGVNQGFVSRLCRGLAMPSLEKAAHIERLTGGEVPMSSWLSPVSAPLDASHNTVERPALGCAGETVNSEGGA